MYQKILLCTDGSESARHAAHAASEIARKCGAEVVSLSVFDTAALIAPYSFVPNAAPDINLILNVAEETQNRAQQETEQILTDAGVSFRAVNEQGHPVHQICAVAERENADVIVLGSRGLSEWQQFILGSVANGVLHHAPCPVWIVRGQQTSFDKILAAWDGSEVADQAVRVAGELARNLQASLTVLNVDAPAGLIGGLLKEIRPKDEVALAEKQLRERLKTVVAENGGQGNPVQETGHAAETIVRYARDNNFPLIVMGSRGMGSFQALTLGSVSSRVAQQAHCSLLIVK